MQDKSVKLSNNERVYHAPDGNVYTFSANRSNENWQSEFGSRKANWEQQGINVQGKKIVPFGENNDLPVVIRNLMDNNHLAPGILARKLGLLYGEGPQLYSLDYVDNNIVRKYSHDPEIWAWLQSFDFIRALQMSMTEYIHMRGTFSRTYLAKGGRIGRANRISKVEIIPSVGARLGWPSVGEPKLENVTEILTGDFENNCMYTGLTPFPVFDAQQPFKYRVSMKYHCTYSFARLFYAVPEYYGTLKWIRRSSDIPDILQYLTDNGITMAFHVKTPADYWQQKRERLEKMHPAEDPAQIEKRLDDLKDETFKKMTEVLAGKKNTGKFIESVTFYDSDQNKCEWEIVPIDQEIKDFIEAQLKISEMANSATTSGLGLHPALSNIVVNGQLSSGSQMLYVMKNYFSSETAIPEEIIFQPFNYAIQANFPGKKLRLGFYRNIIRKEEDVNPEDRITNNA